MSGDELVILNYFREDYNESLLMVIEDEIPKNDENNENTEILIYQVILGVLGVIVCIQLISNILLVMKINKNKGKIDKETQYNEKDIKNNLLETR